MEACCSESGADLSPPAAAETDRAGAQQHKNTVSECTVRSSCLFRP